MRRGNVSSRNKKAKRLLQKRKRQEKKESKKGTENNVRETKQDMIKNTIKGWRKKDTNWESRVSESIDKLIKEIKKGSGYEGELDEDTIASLSKNVMKRVAIYQEIAELTGVPIIRGEALWAIQYEFIYQKELFKQDTLTEEALRDINVHNLKYIIEQTYDRHGNPYMEELKKQVYDNTDVSRIPLTESKVELEEVYTEILEEEFEKLKEILSKEERED